MEKYRKEDPERKEITGGNQKNTKKYTGPYFLIKWHQNPKKSQIPQWKNAFINNIKRAILTRISFFILMENWNFSKIIKETKRILLNRIS